MSGLLEQDNAISIAGHAVELARRAGAGEAEAWISSGQSSSVRVRNGGVDERTAAETGTLTLRVFTDSRTASASTSDLATDALTRLAADAVDLARLSDPDPNVGLPETPSRPPVPNGELDLLDPVLVEPDSGLLEGLARRADAAMRDVDPRVRSGMGATASRSAGVSALVNSRGVSGAYTGTTCWLMAESAAEDEAGRRYEGWWQSSERHLAALEAPESVGQTATRRVIEQLGARPVPTREVPVVWAPEVAWSLLEILAWAASGDVRARGQTFLIDREGQPLASPLVTVTDDATLPGRPGSRPFDAEGVPSRATAIIDRGIFAGFLYDTYSARKAGASSTANAARRTDQLIAGSAVAVAPSNLTLAPGESDPAAIIGGVDHGLYLTATIGSGLNLATGDFSRGASGVWIEGGELAYPVAEINIAGRLPEMLANIDAVGNDPASFETISTPTFRIARMMVSGR